MCVPKMPESSIKIFVMRHGEAENNIVDILSSSEKAIFHLTQLGHAQVQKSISELLKQSEIHLIFSSPILRAYETAKIAAQVCHMAEEEIKVDARLKEPYFGQMEGKTYAEYCKKLDASKEWVLDSISNAETEAEIKSRVESFLHDVGIAYLGKTLLVVTHSFIICRMHKYLTGQTISHPKPAQYFCYPFKESRI